MFNSYGKMFFKFRSISIISTLIISSILISVKSENGEKYPTSVNVERNVDDVTERIPDQIALATRKHDYDFTKAGKYLTIQQQNENPNAKYIPPVEKIDSKLVQSDPQFFEHSLADSESAQEYVNKALQMQLQAVYNADSLQSTGEEFNAISKNPSISRPLTKAPKYEVYESESESGFNGDANVVIRQRTENPIMLQAYEKDSVTRSSYDSSDYSHEDLFGNSRGKFSQPSKQEYSNYDKIESRYSTSHYDPDENIDTSTHRYEKRKPLRQGNTENPLNGISSTRIEKEEIVRYIEESVAKYMQNLENEGKLPAKETKPTVYYRIPSFPHSDIRTSTDEDDREQQNNQDVFSETRYTVGGKVRPTPDSIKLMFKDINNHESSSNTDDDEKLDFIYRVKTRSSSNTGKQKHRNHPPAPQKVTNFPGFSSTLASFDHSGAMKEMQGFDLSHAVHVTPKPTPSKQKFYFNSDTYEDINSLIHKSKKHSRPSGVNNEDEKLGKSEFISISSTTPASTAGNHFNSFGGTKSKLKNAERDNADDGYPIINPYKFLLNQGALPTSYFDGGSLTADATNWQPYVPTKDTSVLMKDFLNSSFFNNAASHLIDSYSPKFNNNPEGYGYQHNFKTLDSFGVSTSKAPVRAIKRGKKGKRPHRNFHNNKDTEASIVLRPPPRNKKSLLT